MTARQNQQAHEERERLILTAALIASGMCADTLGPLLATETGLDAVAERAVALARRIVAEVDKPVTP